MIKLILAKAWRHKWNDESGSATVEAMLVFPLLISVILIMMLASVYVYEHLYVQYVSSTAVERVSYNWDSNDRLIETGQLRSELQYGIYEEELFLTLLNHILPLPTSSASKSLTIPNEAASSTGNLTLDRLHQASSYISKSLPHVNGQISFTYVGLIPKFTSTLRKDTSPLYWNELYLLPPPHYTSHYTIFAPTQYIRNIDLIIHYTNQLRNMSAGEKQKWKSSGEKASKAFSS